MSPTSYRTAPPRAVAPILPQPRPGAGLPGRLAAVPTALLILLAGWLALVTATGTLAGLRARRVARSAIRTQAAVQQLFSPARMAEMQRRVELFDQRRDRLVEAVDRLEHDLHRLRILRGAVADVLEPLFVLRSLLRKG